MQEIITTGLCSPRRGTPLLGTGLMQVFDPHMGPYEGRESEEALFCFVFVM